uniref:Uncharacterized protein n=1 Tax=Arundo donax TaxID=35708 RepID=A0A0A9LUD0_ARUDO
MPRIGSIECFSQALTNRRFSSSV